MLAILLAQSLLLTQPCFVPDASPLNSVSARPGCLPHPSSTLTPLILSSLASDRQLDFSLPRSDLDHSTTTTFAPHLPIMSSRSASQPAPLPLNPYRASSEADYDQYSGSPRSVKSFKFPASSENGDGDESRGPTSPSPASDMGPPPLPAKTTRIPRLSLVPASRDQWQAHRNKLSAGGSSSSLKEMMEKKGGGAITTEIRVECLERRVRSVHTRAAGGSTDPPKADVPPVWYLVWTRNSKEDAVGLAKDILSLCEEAANVKQWYSSLAEKSGSLYSHRPPCPFADCCLLPRCCCSGLDRQHADRVPGREPAAPIEPRQPQAEKSVSHHCRLL